MRYKKNRFMNILLYAQTGSCNIGDEAILCGAISLIKKCVPNSNLFISTSNSKLTEYFNPNIIPIKISFKRPLNLYNLFRIMNVYMNVGGQVINQRSVHKRFLFFMICKLLGVKIFHNSVGVNKMEGFKALLGKFICNFSSSFSVRDRKSYENIGNICRCKIKILPDTAFGISPQKINENRIDVFYKHECHKILDFQEGPIIGISIRDFGDHVDNSFYSYMINEISKFSKKVILEQKAKVIFFPMMQGTHNDLKICEKTANKIGLPEHIFIIRQLPRISELLLLFSKLDCMVGARLHSLILAFLQGIPVIALDHYWKIREFMKNINMEKYCLQDTKLEQLEYLYSNISKEYPKIKKIINYKRNMFKKQLEKEYEEIFRNLRMK